MPQNEAGKLRYRPQYCGAVARRKPRPTLVAMAGHCYRQMKDVVVNDKVHRGHSSELKDSSRPCTHKWSLVSGGWSMSLPPITEVGRRIQVCIWLSVYEYTP